MSVSKRILAVAISVAMLVQMTFAVGANVAAEEEIDIETSITNLTKVSVTFTCRIFHAGTNKLAAEGYTKHAFIDSSGQLLRNGNKLEEYLRDKVTEG